MAKKKNNQTVVNNIESLNLNIDTDKLAEAIVKAQDEANQKKSVSRDMMKFVIVPGLVVLAGFCTFIAIVAFMMFCRTLSDTVSAPPNSVIEIIATIIVLLIDFFIFFFSVSLSVLLFLSSKEVDKETDRQYVASIFSNIVALVALIVALIALAKEVG